MNRKVLALCILVLVVAMLFAGCDSLVQGMEDAQLRQSCEQMLDALLANDLEKGYALISQACTEEEFSKAFGQMREFLGEMDGYELSFLSIDTIRTKHEGADVQISSATYAINTAREQILVSLRADSRLGLTAFYLTPYEKTDLYSTGDLANMKDATVMQWVVLLLNLPVLGCMIYALVDCCRQKFKGKVWWIIWILLGFISVSFTMSGQGFRAGVNVGVIGGYAALVRYGSGTVLLRLMLPVGAFSYFAGKKKQIETQPTEDTPEQTV